uniref:Uncharacterized protein n=1 Tax=Oryza meridionalis TaxID=40149 RepID=A0A0E0DQU9_9ORYZ
MVVEISRLALGGGGGAGERLPAVGEDSAAATNTGKRPVARSSLAAMVAVVAGIQPDAFALGWPAEYPAGDGERDLLKVVHRRLPGRRDVPDAAGGVGGGRSEQRLASAFAEALALRFILPCDGVDH